MAPVGVLAKRGMILGGGRGPVKGIRIKDFCMKTAWMNEWVFVPIQSFTSSRLEEMGVLSSMLREDVSVME
jgi:hypothetical protein